VCVCERERQRERKRENVCVYTHKRTHAHTHRKRLEGKSEEEKKFEIRNMQIQMLLSVVDGNRKAVESDPKNAVQVSLLYFIGPFWTETARLRRVTPTKKKSVQLSELAKSLFELAMLQTRNEGPLN
jgi:hypothetical protein